MPNWCENTLMVSGDKREIKKFKILAKAKGTALSLAKLYPEPDYKKIKVKPTFPGIDKQFNKKRKFVDPKESWWDWRVQNWGTKWDVDAELTMEEDDYLEYQFDSAWSPPVEWLREIVKKFKKLKFSLKYDEPGMCFMGAARAEKGKIVEDGSVNY